jgi:zinc transport system substrate-binding protein
VRNVAGDKADVTTLLPSGANPHTYEPSASDVTAVANAKLLVTNGLGLDFWVEKLKTAANSDLLVVDTSLVPAMEGELLAGDADDAGGKNPHIWLDPVLTQKQVEAIAAALVMVDPANKDFYLENAANYVGELKSLDEEIRGVTDSFSSREFISSHPSWVYFAQNYGLVEAAVIEESPGKEDLSPGYVMQVVDTAKEHNIKVIFAELQFTTKPAETIAHACGAKVILLDTIGGAEVPGRDSYIAMMRYNVDLMAGVMK